MSLFIMEEKDFFADICDIKSQTHQTSFIGVSEQVDKSPSVLGKLEDEEN